MAVEPSEVMLEQRAPDAAPVVRGVAEALPLPDVLGFDEPQSADFWLVADYFPEAAAVESARAPQVEQIAAGIAASRVEVVPVPHDCVDGFAGAFWRRPEAYLDPQVRTGISSFSILPDDVVDRAVAELRADLESGVWHERHADLLELDELLNNPARNYS